MRKKTLVLGFGVSGRASARLLLQEESRVIALDENMDSIRKSLESDLSAIELVSRLDSMEGIERIIVSPGIPPSHPLLQEAKRRGIEIIGEIEFALRRLPNRMIAITGTNGKTTTTLMITHVLNQCHIKAKALGNVGVALSSYVLEIDPTEVLVIELSSFQIETLHRKAFDYGLVLNVTEDHLDRYGSMAAYAAAKLSIVRYVKDQKKIYLSKQIKTDYNLEGTSFEESLSEEKHQNIQASFAICKEFGISELNFYKALATFQYPLHRMEWVRNVDGVTYINDSKATNIESVLFAVQSLEGPLTMIVGGRDKGFSYHPWVQAFRGKVNRLIAYGEASEKIKTEMNPFFEVMQVGPFEQAVRLAARCAQKLETVILSPGCSSYDQFDNYECRGRRFKEIVEEIWTEKKQS